MEAKTLGWLGVVVVVAILAARYLRIPCGLGRKSAGIAGTGGLNRVLPWMGS